MSRAHPRLTAARRRIFLQALAQSGCVAIAARLAGYARQYVYELRNLDPDFAEAWDEAKLEAWDALVDEARRRAVEGWLEPIYEAGKVVGSYRRYSDALLMELLRIFRPEKYGSTREVRLHLQAQVRIADGEQAMSRLLQVATPEVRRELEALGQDKSICLYRAARKAGIQAAS